MGRSAVSLIVMTVFVCALLTVSSLQARTPQQGAEAEECLECHTSQVESVPQIVVEDLEQSIHYTLSCLNCHRDTSYPHVSAVPSVDCARCHADQARALGRSIHASPGFTAGSGSSACVACHGTHTVNSAVAENSRTNRMHIDDTCGECHQPQLERIKSSVHGAALSNPEISEWAPTCVTCHSHHVVFASDAPASRSAGRHQLQTCGGCHDAEEFVKALGLPANRAFSYRDTVHGMRARFGAEDVASCSDCHGVHQVLAQSDPSSPIAPENVLSTCRKCHEKANENFVASKFHIEATAESSPGVFAVRWFYIVFIGVLILGFVVHIILDFRGARKKAAGKKP